jgi:RNA polymerase sigma-70 factor (ECF subfamily)
METSAEPAVDVGALFVAHAPFLVRVVERLTGSATQAEDIVQEAFIVAHRRRHELRSEARGWLYRVCANHARQHRRSLWRRFRLLGAVAAEPAREPPVPDDVAARRERGATIRARVLELPFLYREALVLYELEGESTRSIAQLLGVSEGTVSTRVSRAREMFRERWRVGGGEP